MDNNTVNIGDDKVEEPKVGMVFDTSDAAKEYYMRYGEEFGFSVTTRTSRRDDDGECVYMMFACSRAGKGKSKSGNLLRRRPTSKVDCKAKLCVALRPGGKWEVTCIVCDHNHAVSPSRSFCVRCSGGIEPYAGGEIELNARAGMRVVKNRHTCGVEAGGNGLTGNVIDDNLSDKSEAHRFDKMCNAFCEVADLSANSEEKTKKVMNWINEMKKDLNTDVGIYGNSQPGFAMNVGTTAISGDANLTSKESENICSPIPVSSKEPEQLPFKRRQFKMEHVNRKNKGRQKMMESKRKDNNDSNTIQESQIVEREEVSNVADAIFETEDNIGPKDSEVKYESTHIGGSNGKLPTLNIANMKPALSGIPQSGTFAPPTRSNFEHVVRKNKQKRKRVKSDRRNNNDGNTMQESQVVEAEEASNVDGAISETQVSTGIKVNPSMWGVPQIGPPIIPCGGSFAPLMQAYGFGYEINNTIHAKFVHQNLLPPQMVPYWRGAYGTNIVSGSIRMSGIDDATKASNAIQPTVQNLEGDGKPPTGN